MYTHKHTHTHTNTHLGTLLAVQQRLGFVLSYVFNGLAGLMELSRKPEGEFYFLVLFNILVSN